MNNCICWNHVWCFTAKWGPWCTSSMRKCTGERITRKFFKSETLFIFCLLYLPISLSYKAYDTNKPLPSLICRSIFKMTALRLWWIWLRIYTINKAKKIIREIVSYSNKIPVIGLILTYFYKIHWQIYLSSRANSAWSASWSCPPSNQSHVVCSPNWTLAAWIYYSSSVFWDDALCNCSAASEPAFDTSEYNGRIAIT